MRLLILMVIKAAVIAVALWVLYEVGRCSAVHEIYDYKNGRSNELSEDIVCWIKRYDV